MKRTPLTFITTLLLIATSCSDSFESRGDGYYTPDDQESTENEGETGSPLPDIKGVTINTYTAYGSYGNARKGEMTAKGVHQYDSYGNTTQMKGYDGCGVLLYEYFYQYKYDSAGNILELASILDGQIQSRTTYKYNGRGQQIESVIYNGDGSFSSKTTSKYDNSGYPIETILYDANGVVLSKSMYENRYDALGNRIETRNLDGNVVLLSTVCYEYNAQGNIVELVVYNSDGAILLTYTYKYNSRGYVIEFVAYVGNEKTPNSIAEYIYTL